MEFVFLFNHLGSVSLASGGDISSGTGGGSSFSVGVEGPAGISPVVTELSGVVPDGDCPPLPRPLPRRPLHSLIFALMRRNNSMI